jgi:hypothetical protein
MADRDKEIVRMKAPNPFKDFNTNLPATAEKIKQFYDGEQYCKVEGTIEMTKVTGQLTFRLMGETSAYSAFDRQ